MRVVTCDTLYALQFLSEGRAYRRPVQEMLDFIHHPYPLVGALYHVDGRLVIGYMGLPNTFDNTLAYIIRYDIIIEAEFPFFGWCRDLDWIDRPFVRELFYYDLKLYIVGR